MSAAVRQYEADIDQQDSLYKASREAEAQTWNSERTGRSYAMLVDANSLWERGVREASRRANTTANAGSPPRPWRLRP